MSDSDPQPSPPISETQVLLQRWHGGDRDALGDLVSKNIEWIEGFVRKRLGDRLRRKDETYDIVQDAMVEFMNYGPRFVLENQAHFRSLLAKIMNNVLADHHAWYTRRRRDMHRERDLADQTTVRLDASARTQTQPDSAAARAEEKEIVRLALELLRPEDRDVIVRREFDKQEFGAIGEAMAMTAEAARKRFDRALPKLFATIKKLKSGQLDDILRDEE